MLGPTLNLSSKGEAFIKGFEKLRLTAYLDEGGIWTVGYGVTGAGIGKGTVWTADQAERVFETRIGVAEGAVRRCVSVQITQYEFDALVSLAYNIGEGEFAKCSVVRFLNVGHLNEAAEAFMLFIKVDHKLSNGLVRRRKAEMDIFEGISAYSST